MLRKTALFAFAAAMTFGVATLSVSTTSADAAGWQKGGGGMKAGWGHKPGGYGGGGAFKPGYGGKPGGWGHKPGHWGHKPGGWAGKPGGYGHCWKYGHCKPIRPVVWHAPRPVVYAAAPAVYAAAPAVAVAPNPCTCLSKEYTPEGAVLFKDRCTNEAAMNPPVQPQQTTQVVPQYQQQYVQPQPQQ